jgi:hypothetical protein
MYSWTTNGTAWSRLPFSSSWTTESPTASTDGFTNNMHWVGNKLMMTLVKAGDIVESDIQHKERYSPEFISDALANRTGKDVLWNSAKCSDTLFLRHSNYSMYATAYGQSKFVTVGNNTVMTQTTLKGTPTFTTHTGQWRDILYDGTNFVKVGTNAVSYMASTTWTDLTLTGNWTSIVRWNSAYYIMSSAGLKTSINLTDCQIYQLTSQL